MCTLYTEEKQVTHGIFHDTPLDSIAELLLSLVQCLHVHANVFQITHLLEASELLSLLSFCCLPLLLPVVLTAFFLLQ